MNPKQTQGITIMFSLSAQNFTAAFAAIISAAICVLTAVGPAAASMTSSLV